MVHLRTQNYSGESSVVRGTQSTCWLSCGQLCSPFVNFLKEPRMDFYQHFKSSVENWTFTRCDFSSLSLTLLGSQTVAAKSKLGLALENTHSLVSWRCCSLVFRLTTVLFLWTNYCYIEKHLYSSIRLTFVAQGFCLLR